MTPFPNGVYGNTAAMPVACQFEILGDPALLFWSAAA
jgi:hypothetical protein